MTYAPPTITALARYWVSKGGRNLGIVGDTRHQAKGTSYHLGKSQLTPDAYSRKTARDRAGLSEAASAFDFGAINGSYPELRKFSKWFVKRCQTNAPGTQDVREFIYSPDGKVVLRWDRERGVNSEPRAGEADDSHKGHSHASWYRDSEKRPKVGAIRPYFEPAQPAPQPATPAKEEPVATDPNIRLLDAVIDRAEYAKNEIKAKTPNDAVGHLAKINEFAGRVLVSIVGAPAIVSAAATVDDSGDLFSWSDARAGNIDLGSPQQDVYGGFQQWVAVRLGWAKAPAGSVFERGDQDDARQKAVVILGLGERYFPLDVYPLIPDDVLEAVFGTSEPAGIRAAIASYRAQQPGGAGIVDRPETA